MRLSAHRCDACEVGVVVKKDVSVEFGGGGDDQILDREPMLRSLCEFINEPWHPAMLEYHSQDEPSRDPTRFIANVAATRPLTTDALHRWRKELSADELRLFDQLAGKRMTELGYEMDSDEITPALNYERDAFTTLKRGRP